MRANPRAMFMYLGLLLLIGLCLGAAGGPKQRPTSMPTRVASAGGTLPDLVGTWAGAWVDTVFSVTGPMSMTIDVNGDVVSATGTMNLLMVSLGFAEPFSLDGSITGGDLAFSYQFTPASALTSTGSGTLSATALLGGSADLAGTGSVGAPLNYGGYSFTGTAIEGAITGTFEYGAGTGAGPFGLARTSAVAPESWGGIKNRYRPGG